jgi:hypothetical protein
LGFGLVGEAGHAVEHLLCSFVTPSAMVFAGGAFIFCGLALGRAGQAFRATASALLGQHSEQCQNAIKDEHDDENQKLADHG